MTFKRKYIIQVEQVIIPALPCAGMRATQGSHANSKIQTYDLKHLYVIHNVTIEPCVLHWAVSSDS